MKVQAARTAAPSAAAFVAALAALALPAAAFAQHADISPRVGSGRIVADAYDDATGETTPDPRVFGYDFQEDPLDPYFAADPGFNARAGSGLPAGSQLGFGVPGGARFGLPANLSYWGGTGPVSFAAPPSGETLRFNLGSQNVTVGAPSGDLEGFTIGTVAADGSVHRHLNSFLNGSDGNNDPADGNVPADGIYVVPLALALAGPEPVDGSAPLFLVFNNGLSEEAHDAAIEYVRDNIVPEPSGSGVAAAAFGAALLRRRRRA